jgi:hypothetical protein
MPRPVTPRPLGEHVTVLTRVLRQVEVNKGLSEKRRRSVKRHLVLALGELQAEMSR